MKILLVNPNTTVAVTERMAVTARAVASPGTEVVAATVATGVPYISCRAEALLGASALLDVLAIRADGMDAVIVAAFGDPGLDAARELLAIPVVGIAESAMLTACMLGRRFAIVTFAAALQAWYGDMVDHVGLRARCTGVFCLDEPFVAIEGVAEEKAAKLVGLCAQAIAAGAEVIILGGGPLAGLAATVADQVAVPLVDGVAAALRQAETLAALQPRKASAGSFRYPVAKPMTGIAAPVVRLFGGVPGPA